MSLLLFRSVRLHHPCDVLPIGTWRGTRVPPHRYARQIQHTSDIMCIARLGMWLGIPRRASSKAVVAAPVDAGARDRSPTGGVRRAVERKAVLEIGRSSPRRANMSMTRRIPSRRRRRGPAMRGRPRGGVGPRPVRADRCRHSRREGRRCLKGRSGRAC